MQISVIEQSPDCDNAVALLRELDAHLATKAYPPQSCHAFSIDQLIRERVAFFIARADDQPAGCGGIKLFGEEYGEIKRMYVRPEFRGQGVGRAILEHLAGHAREHRVTLLRLETGIHQTEAIGLYERFGFLRCEPFGQYRHDPLSVYFQKCMA